MDYPMYPTATTEEWADWIRHHIEEGYHIGGIAKARARAWELATEGEWMAECAQDILIEHGWNLS